MKKLLGFLCALILVFGMAGIASALPILESEPNNTLATAQNIDSSFSLGANSDIAYSETIPWVSISATGNNSYDYYSFTVMGTNVLGIFDIDYGACQGGIDTVLGLWDSAGNVLAENNNHWPYTDGAEGSVDGHDSYIAYRFALPGTYIIGVAEFGAITHKWGWRCGSNIPDTGDTYTLQVSIPGHGTGTAPVPEPSTILLVGTGLIGIIGFGGRKRLNKKA